MPGAANNFPVSVKLIAARLAGSDHAQHGALRKAPAHVRADVSERIEGAVNVEDGNGALVDLESALPARRQFVDLYQCVLGREPILAVGAAPSTRRPTSNFWRKPQAPGRRHPGGIIGRGLQMLELSNVVVRYGSGSDQLTAVDRVSMQIPAGKTVGLVGESASGKSTVARALVGLLPIAAGKVILDGLDVTSLRSRNSTTYHRRVQMVFQDPYASLNPRMTIGTLIGEALGNSSSANRGNRREQTLQLLHTVGLSDSAIDRYPHQFSGGQRQRISIARALAVQPDLIVLDEVTSSLDVSAQDKILNLLKQLQRQTQIAYLYISHDLSVVGYMSDVVAVMYLGRIVETASCAQLFQEPRHPYTQALIRSIPKVAGRRAPAPLGGEPPDPRRPPRGCRFHTRCPVGPLYATGRGVCIERDPQAIADSQPHRTACHFASVRAGAEPVAGKV
jgi:peptide/nickel transport system ATP-binding protein